MEDDLGDPEYFESVDFSDDPTWSYVPIDPCQSVVAALRLAMEERIPVEFIDLETSQYENWTCSLPDPYALKRVSLARFATAVLPSLRRPKSPAIVDSHTYMGHRLRTLESSYSNIACVCSLPSWPWLREAYNDANREVPEPQEACLPRLMGVDPKTLMFLLGELPFITSLYEQARSELDDEGNLSIDGIKQLLMTARTKYMAEMGKRGRRITPLLLSQCLKYVRNLTLMDRRMTPDLYTIATASRGVIGDQYTIHVVETANDYAMNRETGLLEATMGIDRIRLPNGDTVPAISRLPGVPMDWRPLQLQKRPERWESNEWRSRWNPYRQCSWPPEDTQIESFRTRVFDRARTIMGADLVRTEKFSTSFKDGIDIRETLRHWYDGDIYIKVLPPSVGNLDASIMLFDSPADPRDYPWRATWFAEHHEESTIAFYATHFGQELLGPGVAVSTYGGVLFLYPPRTIRDIWTDKKLDFCETMEERLVAAACLHSECSQVALLSWLPPGPGWRRLAKKYHKTLVHVPMAHFSAEMIQQLRTFHVLNGQEVRSYAAHFIRKA